FSHPIELQHLLAIEIRPPTGTSATSRFRRRWRGSASGSPRRTVGPRARLESEPISFTNDVTIDPTTTRGFIVGHVENLLVEPIVVAHISVPFDAAERTASTGEDGRFVIDGLAGVSSLDVRIEAEGHLPAHTIASLGRSPSPPDSRTAGWYAKA